MNGKGLSNRGHKNCTRYKTIKGIIGYHQASSNVAFGEVGGLVRVMVFWTNARCTRICRFVHKAKKLKITRT